MKKILSLVLTVAFITLMCASVSLGVVVPPGPKPVTDPDNTMTGNPDKAGGVNMGSGNTDMGDFNGSGGIDGPFNSIPGSDPGTKLFGTFPKSGD